MQRRNNKTIGASILILLMFFGVFPNPCLDMITSAKVVSADSALVQDSSSGDSMTQESYVTIQSSTTFHYQHDPMVNPKAAADIKEDPEAVYGYRPRSDSKRLGVYADYDWTDPVLVASFREDREKYHESIKELYTMIDTMKAEGCSTEEIARAVSTRRNEIRLEQCDTPEKLESTKQSNLQTYGNELGGTPEYFYEKYGSWETVIEKSLSTNAGADACLGLYDIYYDTYIFDCTHKWDTAYTIDKAATCAEEGSESIHCVECGQIKAGSSISIPKKDHNYGQWQVKKQSTYTEAGQKTRTCSACGYVQTETIPTKKYVITIKITGISKRIAAGKQIQLTTKILPTDAADQRVKWTSSDNKLANVSKTGKVTMKKKSAGKTVTITAATMDGSGKKASWKIESMKGQVKSITIKGSKTIKAGSSRRLQATVKATAGANKALKWSTSNKKYATVTSKGLVKTKKAGKGKTVKITMKATDGTGKKKTVGIRIR